MAPFTAAMGKETRNQTTSEDARREDTEQTQRGPRDMPLQIPYTSTSGNTCDTIRNSKDEMQRRRPYTSRGVGSQNGGGQRAETRRAPGPGTRRGVEWPETDPTRASIWLGGRGPTHEAGGRLLFSALRSLVFATYGIMLCFERVKLTSRSEPQWILVTSRD